MEVHFRGEVLAKLNLNAARIAGAREARCNALKRECAEPRKVWFLQRKKPPKEKNYFAE